MTVFTFLFFANVGFWRIATRIIPKARHRVTVHLHALFSPGTIGFTRLPVFEHQRIFGTKLPNPAPNNFKVIQTDPVLLIKNQKRLKEHATIVARENKMIYGGCINV